MIEITELRLSEELTTDGITMAEIDIRYPSVTGASKHVLRRINAFYAHWAKTLMRSAKKSALASSSAEYLAALEASAVFRPLKVTAAFEVTYNDEHVLSLYRDFEARSGSTVRAQTRQGDTWCVPTGWLIELRAFFPKGDKPRHILIKNAVESAQLLQSAGTHSFYGNFDKLIKRKFSHDNFYITEEGIATFYARGDIAPESEGIPVFIYTQRDFAHCNEQPVALPLEPATF